jgi:hypothetical protein
VVKKWMVVVGVLFVIGAVLPKGNKPGDAGTSSAPPKPTSTAPTKIDAWVMAQQFVERELKSPGSAEWGSVLDGTFQRPDEHVVANPDGTFSVQGWVDAQNSFGAKMRANWTIKLKKLPGEDRWQALEGPTLTQR